LGKSKRPKLSLLENDEGPAPSLEPGLQVGGGGRI
jgi:hypothetical protein